MFYWGKIIGAILGLATGRLWMVLIGLLIGHQFDRRLAERFFHYQRKAGSSYLSANDPRLTIGLGAAKVIDQVIIRWSSGQVQRFFGLAVNSAYRLIEGQDPEPLNPLVSPQHSEDRTGE